MPAPIIRTRGLTKRFGDFTAVDDLSIEVTPGTIFAFIGANGSGKSTTIRMLIGLLKPTAGTVEVDGVDVIARPRRVRDHIGYMGQKVSLYQGLTLRENVEFYAGLYALAGKELEDRWGALRARRGGGREARGPARRHPAARRPGARDAAPAAGALPRRADRGRRRAEPRPLLGPHPGRGRRRRDGLRHHPLPRGGRVLRLGGL